jgi:hypothetical protein
MILIDRPLFQAHGRRFAHLISDRTLDELHAFGVDLGLPRRLFHHDHYDVPASWWPKAIELGATEVDPRVLVRRLRASGLRVPPARRQAAASSATPDAHARQNAR